MAAMMFAASQPMGRPDEWMGWAVLGFGGLSAFFGVLYSSPQRDLKRQLGYSSTENVGIAAMGFGVGYLGWTWGVPSLALCGFAGGLLHILNHAFFKCLLFYAAGAVYRATHTVDLERLGGLAKRMPRTALLFLVSGIAMVFATFCILMAMTFVATGRTIFPMIWGQPKAPRAWPRQTFVSASPKLIFLACLVVLGVYVPSSVNGLLEQVATSLEAP